MFAQLTSFLMLSVFFSFMSFSSAFAQSHAYFAAGCFWCIEKDLEKVKGVNEVMSGYMGGTAENPTYKQVTAGGTGHYEVVKVSYNPEIVTYKTLLEYFFANVDYYDDGGQFCDRGHSYKSAIFVQDKREKALSEQAIQVLEAKHKKKVVTPVLEYKIFYKAEDYHQDYYKKNSKRYSFYRWSCGRDKRLQELRGKAMKLLLF